MRGRQHFNQGNPPAHPLSSCPSRLASSARPPEIKGFLETSFIDWPGKLCAVIFLGGCNFRCPFCHNHRLVLAPESFATLPLEAIRNRLQSYKKWLGGVCISGGEPTLDPGLPVLAATLKNDGWLVKLDTNGARPRVLEGLLKDGLLDMVAMDVKAPLRQEKYNRCAGVRVNLDDIRQSIRLLKQSGIDHEFRMTVVPLFHSKTDLAAWKKSLEGGSRLKLQNFHPRTTLDSSLQEEKGFSPEVFSELQELIA